MAISRDQVKSFFKKPENDLAMIAILFAVVQFVDARLQERKMTLIAQSMTTRFIGLFPKNMKEITDVLNGADAHLDVMVDFVGYGHYSNPQGFDSYFNDLLSKRPKADFRMIIYGEGPAATSQTSQFDFDHEKTSQRFNAFFRQVHSGRKVPSTPQEFDSALNDYQNEYKKRLCDKGVEIRTINHSLLFFLWLEDNEQAVFSFQNTGEREREISTRTSDANLIAPLHEIFVNTWNNDSAPLCNADGRHP
jgi:hypothetical protein